jgi:hypothetical protein
MLPQGMQLAGRNFVALESILISMDAHIVGGVLVKKRGGAAGGAVSAIDAP